MAETIETQAPEPPDWVNTEAGRIIKAEGSTCQRNNNYVYTLSLIYDDGGATLL